MKANRITNLVTVAFGLAVFSTAGCAEKEMMAEASLPPAKDAAPATARTASPGPIPAVPVVAAASPDVAFAKWDDIKDYAYDRRAQFFAGLKRLEVKVEEQRHELITKRTGMKGSTNTKDWDFAMKEMEDARSYLHSMGAALSKAAYETWEQEKDKVGLAWVRTQEAYDKVKSKVTE